MPQVFQQTLWVGGTGEQGEGQEIVLPRCELGSRSKRLGPFSISSVTPYNKTGGAIGASEWPHRIELRSRPCFVGGWYPALGRTGRFDEGLRTIDEAFPFIERTGQRLYEAEVHRLKGELL
ncbi:MAG: hypothetical protein ACLQDV_28360, partial [Candidatus Binataceae bacterium]